MWNLFLLWNVHHFSLSFFSVSCFVIRYDGFLFFSLVSSFESSIECTKYESTTKLTEKKETSYESYMLHLKAQLDIAGEKYTHTHLLAQSNCPENMRAIKNPQKTISWTERFASDRAYAQSCAVALVKCVLLSLQFLIFLMLWSQCFNSDIYSYWWI